MRMTPQGIKCFASLLIILRGLSGSSSFWIPLGGLHALRGRPLNALRGRVVLMTAVITRVVMRLRMGRSLHWTKAS